VEKQFQLRVQEEGRPDLGQSVDSAQQVDQYASILGWAGGCLLHIRSSGDPIKIWPTRYLSDTEWQQALNEIQADLVSRFFIPSKWQISWK
jgi:hypothetical protein